MNFFAFLIAVFSVSNAELWPANSLDNSDFLTGLPLLDSPLPDSLSLNLPVPGNELSSFDLNLNEPGENDAGDSGESSTVTPSIPYAETQIHTDGSNGICNPDGSTGQKRRKRLSPFCQNPDILEFHPRVPKKAQAGSTKIEEANDEMARRDSQWLIEQFAILYGPDWRDTMDISKRQDALTLLSKPGDDACAKQTAEQANYVRAYALCCLGPSEIVEPQLARRQNAVTIVNWFNCDQDILERPFCLFSPFRVCCVHHNSYSYPGDSITRDPADWWRWGFKGVDCVDRSA